ncbi:MAG: hypothetical protein OXJ52_03410 [Oligoflexia bacterium]|nr:hypothetical protein [Oligoflexia bacterium]
MFALLTAKGSVVAKASLEVQMRECKLSIERVRIKRNRGELLAEGVSLANIECYSHTLDERTQVNSWFIERAGGKCYDKTSGNKPARSDSIGSEGRTPPSSTAEKESALKTCQTNLSSLKKELSLKYSMRNCKLKTELAKIQINKEKLLISGVPLANIECYFRTLDERVQVKSWFIERAEGICYDKTAENKPARSDSIGSEGQKPLGSIAEKESTLKTCQANLKSMRKEAGLGLNRKMAHCKSQIEHKRIKLNKLLLTRAGVYAGNIECYSHTPEERKRTNVKSWFIERAGGKCYDKRAENKPARSDSIGSKGRKMPENRAEKEAALRACRTNSSRIHKELERLSALPIADQKLEIEMASCKLEIEQLRIKRNKLKLLNAGVNEIECYSHPSVCMVTKAGQICRPTVSDLNLKVKSWFVERAGGVCYDKFAENKPSMSDSMGSEGRTPPSSFAEKKAALATCQKNLKRLRVELEQPEAGTTGKK